MDWNGFSRYYDWEFDLICSEQRKDVEFWLGCTAEFCGPILELACGSGRITVPLLKAGYDLTAVDNSPRMLKILKSRTEDFLNLTIIQAGLTDFRSERKFGFAFISYSSLQQLLTMKEQETCLRTVKAHLVPSGILGIDIGTGICDPPLEQPLQMLYRNDFPPGNSRVTMFTSWTTDREAGVRHWEDLYVEDIKDGSRREFTNRISLRECRQDHMNKLFHNAGFRIRNIFGSFDRGEVRETSTNHLYLVESI